MKTRLKRRLSQWLLFQYFRLRLVARIGVTYVSYAHPIMKDCIGCYRLGDRTIAFKHQSGARIVTIAFERQGSETK